MLVVNILCEQYFQRVGDEANIIDKRRPHNAFISKRSGGLKRSVTELLCSVKPRITSSFFAHGSHCVSDMMNITLLLETHYTLH